MSLPHVLPMFLLTYEPPLQFRRGAVGIRPTRFIILACTARAAGSRPYGGVDVICTRQITICR